MAHFFGSRRCSCTRLAITFLLVLAVHLATTATALTPTPSPPPPIPLPDDIADVPAPCLVPGSASLKLSSSCPALYQGTFAACGVFKEFDDCRLFCRQTILAHAVLAQSCSGAPSLVDLFFLGNACRLRCLQERENLGKLRVTGARVAHALVQVSWLGRWRYETKGLLFNPSLPSNRMKPGPIPTSNCWLCEWDATACSTACENASSYPRWGFEIS